MSDVQKLKEAIAEYRKANKGLDDKLRKAEEELRQTRQVEAEKQRRQD